MYNIFLNQEEIKTTTFELAKSDTISPPTNYSFEWTHTPNTTNNSFIETTTITLTATDNNWWVWINTIYYAIWTDTGTLI